MTHIGAIVNGHGQIARTIRAVVQSATDECTCTFGNPGVVHTNHEGVARWIANDAIPEQTLVAIAFAKLKYAAFGAGGAGFHVSVQVTNAVKQSRWGQMRAWEKWTYQPAAYGDWVDGQVATLRAANMLIMRTIVVGKSVRTRDEALKVDNEAISISWLNG